MIMRFSILNGLLLPLRPHYILCVAFFFVHTWMHPSTRPHTFSLTRFQEIVFGGTANTNPSAFCSSKAQGAPEIVDVHTRNPFMNRKVPGPLQFRHRMADINRGDVDKFPQNALTTTGDKDECLASSAPSTFVRFFHEFTGGEFYS